MIIYNMRDLLEKLGLYEDEAKVYVAILELGKGYVSSIAKHAGVHRVTTYHTLENLVKKGLVSLSKEHKTSVYRAENPEKLVKKQVEKLQIAEKLLPELKGLMTVQAAKPTIRFIEGVEGIKGIFEETLETNDEILGYTNIDNLTALLKDYLYYYARERCKKKIHSRFLSPYSALARTFLATYFADDLKREIAEILYIDPTEFHFENEVYIYGNKVATFSPNPKELIGVIIESPLFSETHRSIFNLSWLGATSFIAG